ncbi:Aste57867_21654 [Aphanomyces stellatus]|uniref:Aste57867_21654 protein n=1 Tax=Aphanomyces stellatus TaxID=120398 RepID=A0A485LJF0_9STRA|nr:hypothetical protein As57867_021585 [Aphanomyces stellatus]VFT98323.1 Aste57867_21654 [Aphanomyces stellatus]
MQGSRRRFEKDSLSMEDDDGDHVPEIPFHPIAVLDDDHHHSTHKKRCSRNTFISNDMFVQLRHISLCNIFLLAAGFLADSDLRASNNTDTCARYNFARVMLRTVLFVTTVLLYLPATGRPAFRLYRLHQAPGAPSPLVHRTTFLRLCEVLALCQIVLMVGTAALIVLGNVFPHWTYSCHSRLPRPVFVSVLVGSYLLSAYDYVVTWKLLLYFHQLRTHLLFQHGVFTHDKSDTTAVHERTPQDALRHRIWTAIMQRDDDHLTAALDDAAAVDSEFATAWYPSATLWCGGFLARSERHPLHLAIKSNQPAMVTTLLERGFDPNARSKIELTTFLLRDIYYKIFCFFAPCRTDLPSSYGPAGWFQHTLLTPLHMAVIHADLDMARELLDAGADPNRIALSNVPLAATPPLFWVDNVRVTTLLLQGGANQLFVPKEGFYLTPYEHAILHGHRAIARTLETWGSDIALTPLHDAAAKGNVGHVLSYLKNSCNPLNVDALGEQSNGLFCRTPLHWAAIRGQLETARALLAHGANVEARDAVGRTPLAWACYLNHRPLVAMLLEEFKADANALDAMGRTIAILCADQEDVDADVFHLLRQHGLYDFGQLANGDTPLHIAMKKSYQRTAIALVRAGSSSSLTTVNSDGVRAIDATPSSALQFIIKKEAGERDVMISYSHKMAAVALKLRASLEANCLTTWMDLMDPTGINGGSVWRDEIARGIKNAAVVLCVLSEDYPSSQWCMKELAFAKEHNVPVVAALVTTTTMTDELQVYLWSRQLVDFRDESHYDAQMRSLLDGLRTEVEKRRTGHQRATIAAHRPLLHGSRPTYMLPFNPNARFVYISHGQCHPEVAQRIQERLWQRNILAYVDNTCVNETISAKDAILQCDAFIILLSDQSAHSSLLTDQLAFAENREKRIVPLLYSKNFLQLAHEYTFARHTSVVHINDGLGFNESVAKLAQSLPTIDEVDMATGDARTATPPTTHGAIVD